MKEAKDWMTALSDAGDDHECNCICERCKQGRETFLLESDLVKIKINTLRWAMHQTTDGIQSKIVSLVKANDQANDRGHLPDERLAWRDLQLGERLMPGDRRHDQPEALTDIRKAMKDFTHFTHDEIVQLIYTFRISSAAFTEQGLKTIAKLEALREASSWTAPVEVLLKRLAALPTVFPGRKSLTVVMSGQLAGGEKQLQIRLTAKTQGCLRGVVKPIAGNSTVEEAFSEMQKILMEGDDDEAPRDQRFLGEDECGKPDLWAKDETD